MGPTALRALAAASSTCFSHARCGRKSGWLASRRQGGTKTGAGDHERTVRGEGGIVRGLVCRRAIAAKALARPLLEGADAVPEVQCLEQHKGWHLPFAVLSEVGVLFAERDQGAAVIARSRGLE